MDATGETAQKIAIAEKAFYQAALSPPNPGGLLQRRSHVTDRRDQQSQALKIMIMIIIIIIMVVVFAPCLKSLKRASKMDEIRDVLGCSVAQPHPAGPVSMCVRVCVRVC